MNTLYLHPKITRRNRHFVWLILARIAKQFPQSNIIRLKEPAMCSVDKAIAHYESIITDNQNYLCCSVAQVAKRVVFSEVIDIREIKPSFDSVHGLISYLIHDFHHYVLTDWFMDDMETCTVGKDRRRRSEFRIEITKHVDQITAKDWQVKLAAHEVKAQIASI